MLRTFGLEKQTDEADKWQQWRWLSKGTSENEILAFEIEGYTYRLGLTKAEELLQRRMQTKRRNKEPDEVQLRLQGLHYLPWRRELAEQMEKSRKVNKNQEKVPWQELVWIRRQ